MMTSLGAIDLLVLGASLLAVVVIGMRVSGKTDNLEAYLLGDRNLPWWAILGSIVATETSTATVLSVPGIGYGPVGFRFLQLSLGYICGRTVVVKVLLPLYFKGRLFSAYQVLDQRFGTRTKQAASILFLITRNLGDGLRLFLAAMVLQQLAGWPFWCSLVVMGFVTMFYTYFGGMRSVVWNDCLQFVIYMVGAIAAVFVIVANIPGGWGELGRFAISNDKLRMFDFEPSWSQPYNFWAGLIGGAVLTIGTHGTDHMMVQRYLSARSQSDAGLAIFASGLVVFFQFALFLFIGVELACYYAGHPEISFEKSDQVFAHFIVNHFPRNTGLVGLMLAAILAAAMSTLSSSLNSSASALVNDFYLPSLKTPLSPEQSLAVTRNLTLLFGVVQIGVGFWATQLTRSVVDNALTIAGFSAGLLLGVYALGVMTKRVGQTAALIASTGGLAVLLLIQFGVGPIGVALSPPQVWKPIAWPWLAFVGATTTILLGLILSPLFPQSSQESEI